MNAIDKYLPLSLSVLGAALFGAVVGRIARREYLRQRLRYEAELARWVERVRLRAGEDAQKGVEGKQNAEEKSAPGKPSAAPRRTRELLPGVHALFIVLGVLGGAVPFIIFREPGLDLGSYGIGLAVGFFSSLWEPRHDEVIRK